MPRFLRATLVLLFSQAIASCATESIGASAAVDPSNAATISGDSEFNFLPAMAVVIKEVDGVPVQKTVTRVSVSPGHHKLVVRCEVINAARYYMQTLEVDVVPKGTYRLGVKVGQSAGPCQAVAVKTN
jgi:hypothetical protein